MCSTVYLSQVTVCGNRATSILVFIHNHTHNILRNEKSALDVATAHTSIGFVGFQKSLNLTPIANYAAATSSHIPCALYPARMIVIDSPLFPVPARKNIGTVFARLALRARFGGGT